MAALVISRDMTTLYKGVGILLIVLHNYFHNIPPVIGENEFTFQLSVTERFIDTMLGHPGEWFRAVMSYAGHYGVQLFIFLSAYGLTRRYLDTSVQYFAFLRTRFIKIYISFVICIVVYICLGILKSQFLTDEQVLYWDSLLWKVLLLSNFVPGQAMMPVGPWWFMPFIFQFYLIYPLLLIAYKWSGYKILLAVAIASVVLEWSLNSYFIRHGVNLNLMVFGHLPVFCLGICLAAREDSYLSTGAVVMALAVFVAGSYYETAWILTDLSAAILLLVCAGRYLQKLPEKSLLFRFLYFYGAISLYLFMVNGFLRSPFHIMAVSVDRWWFTLVCGLLSLVFSTAFAVALKKLDEWLRQMYIARFA